MHLDEIQDRVDRIPLPPGGDRTDLSGMITWHWTELVMGSLRCGTVEAVLDCGGHLFVAAQFDGDPDEALGHARAWMTGFYMAILSNWSVLHADVLRGVVTVGTAAATGAVSEGRFTVRDADPDGLVGTDVSLDTLAALLFTESCRRFIYCTTERFREFGHELNALRADVTQSRTPQAERISVLANRRIEDSRTVRTRVEIAVQTIENRLQHHQDSVRGLERELADLLLVAEHMQSVWSTQEQNFEWVVQHAGLRVGIAERNATRGFTAAVFAVAVVALMRDVVDSSLTIGVIHWSVYRVLSLILGCFTVVTVSYLLFLVGRRLFR